MKRSETTNKSLKDHWSPTSIWKILTCFTLNSQYPRFPADCSLILTWLQQVSTFGCMVSVFPQKRWRSFVFFLFLKRPISEATQATWQDPKWSFGEVICFAEKRPKEVFLLTSFRKRCFAEMVLAGSHHHRWNMLCVISQEELSAPWLGFRRFCFCSQTTNCNTLVWQ